MRTLWMMVVVILAWGCAPAPQPLQSVSMPQDAPTQVASPAPATATGVPTQTVAPTQTTIPTKTAVPTPAYTLSAVRSAPEICKIQEQSRYRQPGDPILDVRGQAEIQGRYTGNASAFPFNPTVLPIQGTLRVAMIFVDWADSPGTDKDYAYYQAQMQHFKDFYWMVSEHTLDVEVRYSDGWFRIPGSYQDFVIDEAGEAQRGEAPLKQVFYDAAVAASDDATDYTDVDVVYFAVPLGQIVFEHGGPHEFNFDHNGYLPTAEGPIYDTATAGYFFLQKPSQPPWTYYVHETGHMLGIGHLAISALTNAGGYEKWQDQPMGGYDIMSNQGGASRTISGWLRWLAGWLTDEQVVCVTRDAVLDEYYELSPLNEVQGKQEVLVIKLSDTKVVVVESRRFDPNFDINTGNSKDGLLVYTVDATLTPTEGALQLLSPRDIRAYVDEKNTWDWRELDAMLFAGDRIVIDGIVIEAFAHTPERDVVRITAAP